MQPGLLWPLSASARERRFREFLRWFIPALLGFGSLFALLGLATTTPDLVWAGIVVLVYGALLLRAARLAATGREGPAVRLTYGGMLLTTVAVVPLQPDLFPALAVVPFIAAGVALPHGSPAGQERVIILSCLVAVLNLACGQILVALGGPPTPLEVGLAISSFSAAAFYLTFLLWQFGRGLVEGLAESLAANAALREAREIERQMLDHQRWESLGVLAGGIAHDFNNLLTAIIGNAALARLDLPAGCDGEQALSDVERAAERAAELTRQMLTYAGRGAISLAAVDLNTVAQEVCDLAESGLDRHALRLSLAPDLPPAYGNGAQLRQALLSLVVNAAEATAARGEVWVGTGVAAAAPPPLALSHRYLPAEGGPVLWLEVGDSGAGMDAATLARVCEPFFSTKFTGRGLGLAAALGIARGHRGALEGESAPGAGSRFRLLLPLHPASLAAPAEPVSE